MNKLSAAAGPANPKVVSGHSTGLAKLSGWPNLHDLTLDERISETETKEKKSGQRRKVGRLDFWLAHLYSSTRPIQL